MSEYPSTKNKTDADPYLPVGISLNPYSQRSVTNSCPHRPQTGCATPNPDEATRTSGAAPHCGQRRSATRRDESGRPCGSTSPISSSSATATSRFFDINPEEAHQFLDLDAVQLFVRQGHGFIVETEPSLVVSRHGDRLVSEEFDHFLVDGLRFLHAFVLRECVDP